MREEAEKIEGPGRQGHPVVPSEPEKARVSVREGDELYREIRIENVVSDEHGEEAQLKPGAQVDVIVEADSSATIKKLGVLKPIRIICEKRQRDPRSCGR